MKRLLAILACILIASVSFASKEVVFSKDKTKASFVTKDTLKNECGINIKIDTIATFPVSPLALPYLNVVNFEKLLKGEKVNIADTIISDNEKTELFSESTKFSGRYLKIFDSGIEADSTLVSSLYDLNQTHLIGLLSLILFLGVIFVLRNSVSKKDLRKLLPTIMIINFLLYQTVQITLFDAMVMSLIITIATSLFSLLFIVRIRKRSLKEDCYHIETPIYKYKDGRMILCTWTAKNENITLVDKNFKRLKLPYNQTDRYYIDGKSYWIVRDTSRKNSTGMINPETLDYIYKQEYKEILGFPSAQAFKVLSKDNNVSIFSVSKNREVLSNEPCKGFKVDNKSIIINTGKLSLTRVDENGNTWLGC